MEALQAVAAFSLLPDYVKYGVNKLGALGVMTFSPVVAGSGLSEDEVVGSKELTKRSGSDGVHCAGLEIHKDGPGDIPTSSGFVEIDVDPLKL